MERLNRSTNNFGKKKFRRKRDRRTVDNREIFQINENQNQIIKMNESEYKTLGINVNKQKMNDSMRNVQRQKHYGTLEVRIKSMREIAGQNMYSSKGYIKSKMYLS